GVWTRAWDQVARGRAGLVGPPNLVAAMRTDALALAISVAAVVAALLLIGRWVQARAQLAHLAPGQRRKRPATLVMTAISIAGVAVGVWALTVVLSVMSGFEADLKKKILGTNAHALLLKYSSDFSEWKAVMPKVLSAPGTARAGGRGRRRGAGRHRPGGHGADRADSALAVVPGRVHPLLRNVRVRLEVRLHRHPGSAEVLPHGRQRHRPRAEVPGRGRGARR